MYISHSAHFLLFNKTLKFLENFSFTSNKKIAISYKYPVTFIIFFKAEILFANHDDRRAHVATRAYIDIQLLRLSRWTTT